MQSRTNVFVTMYAWVATPSKSSLSKKKKSARWLARVVGEKVGFYQVVYEKVWLCVGAVGV